MILDLFRKEIEFNNIHGYDDMKDIVRRALDAQDNYNLLFIGPPASAKTLFLLGILESKKRVYFDGSNTTNRIIDVLEEKRPKIICVDELDKMPKQFQEKLLNFMESAQLDLTKGRIAPWYEIGSPSDCGDKDPMCCQGCPLDDAKYMGAAGFRPLVGVWQMVNVTKTGIVDKNTSGVATFSINGSYDLAFPAPVEISIYGYKSSHVGDYWASDGHSLVVTYGDMLDYAEMNFTKQSHDHMELTDGHGDTIHLTLLAVPTKAWATSETVVGPNGTWATMTSHMEAISLA
jgi:hypothetical protein